MANYFDKSGNYINVENLSLAEIYNRGYQDGSEDGLQGIRPKGEWIWRETGTSNFRYGYFTCSNCSFVSKAKQNFCAECGADMRKEGNG